MVSDRQRLYYIGISLSTGACRRANFTEGWIMASRHYRLYCICLLPICLLAILVQVQARRRQTALRESLRLGRFTAQQILARAQPVVAAIAPPGAAVQVTMEPFPGNPPVWFITCLTAQKDYAAIQLNAENGELIEMGGDSIGTGGRPELLDEREAVRCCEEWIGRLGPILNGIHWRFDRPTRGLHVWIFQGRSADRHLELKVQRRSGALLNAIIWRNRGRPSF